MKSFLSLFAVALLATSAWGQTPEPQVQVAEVLRRGDVVTVMGEGPRAAPEEAYAAAMAPPADDSHLWSVSLWTTPNCAACERLKADFRQAPELQAFVAAPAPELPWAHYVEYSGADETQKDRREKYKVTRYPTIVVQPPRNQMWGDPGLVVFYDNSGYSDAKLLAAKIQRAVRRFAEVQGRKGFPKLASTQLPGAGQYGVNPPFLTPPPPAPFNPNLAPAPTPTQFPPPEQPAAANLMQLLSLVGTLFGSFLPSGSTMTAVLMAALLFLRVWEFRAKKTPQTWDDNAIAFVRSLIDSAPNQSDPKAGPTPPAKP